MSNVKESKGEEEEEEGGPGENSHVCISVGVRKGEKLSGEREKKKKKKKDEESEDMKEGQTARWTTECLRK